MATDSVVQLMNSNELFARPPSKKWDEWLIRGELRRRKMTKRNPGHSRATARISQLLLNWLETQPEPRGGIYDGEAYFRMRTNPDTNVGIDVAYASAELVARTGRDDSYLDGPPILAVEVLSPYDKQRDIDEAQEEYLACGVQQVWFVNPRVQTVTVYRPGKPPELFNNTQDLSGDPDLPGFRVPVARIFA